jgi:hypothetical protein
MGMFDTTGNAQGSLNRKENTLKKLERMKKALSHQEPDCVPVSDFFWGGFIKRWREELNLPEDANPYFYYDLDWIVTVPNMDPFIRSFETLKESDKEVVVKTGFGAVIRKKFDAPMPEFIDFETNSIEKLEGLEFDDPHDKRRYYEAGDNQIAGVGDGFERNSPAWIETIKSLYPDFPVFGSLACIRKGWQKSSAISESFILNAQRPRLTLPMGFSMVLLSGVMLLIRRRCSFLPIIGVRILNPMLKR